MRIMVTGGRDSSPRMSRRRTWKRDTRFLVLDNLSSGKKENVPEGARFVFGEAGSETAVEAIRTFRPEILCHHAAQINVRKSVADPVFDAKENIVSTLVLLEAAREHGVRKVLFSSSGGAGYGEQEYFPADEKHRCAPFPPTGWRRSPWSSISITTVSSTGWNTRHCGTRTCTGLDRTPTGRRAWSPSSARRLLKGQTALVNGDGLQTRDYVYVGDVVRANLAALSRGDGLSINIGTGIETDVNTLSGRCGTSPGAARRRSTASDAGEQRRSVIENGMAFNELGWYPDVPLEKGLALTLAYFRDKVKSSGTR